MRVVSVVAALAVMALAGCRFAVRALPEEPPTDDFGFTDDFGPPVPDGATPGGIGWPCASPSDCDNGTCVDGYCCDSLCDPGVPANLCAACNVPGSEGHCVPALAGTDPHQQCTADTMASCGHDGLCDGAGHCRLWAAGTVCGGATCSSDTETYAPTCDGNGHCLAGTSVSCYPYACGSGACDTSCTQPANGCQSPAVCNAMGSCGPRALGQPCSKPTDCASGFCAQGVCCDQACNGGNCYACNQPSSPGHCKPLPNGTTCGPATCNGDDAVSARACDGAGTCQPGTVTVCVPYTCNQSNATCYQRPCFSNLQCAMGHFCNGGSHKCQ